MAALALFSGATMIRSLTVGVLLLEIGIILAVMLVPSPHPRSQMTAMRTLILLAMVGPMLSLASWALEGNATNVNSGPNLRVGAIVLAVGMGLALPVAPLHIWLPPIYRYSTPLAIVVSTAVLNVVVLMRIYDILPLVPWAAGKEFFAALLLGGGVLTAVLGGVLTLPQRALHRALAFAALADAGLALIGFGIGTEAVMRTAMLHALYRALAVTVVSMALGVFRTWLNGDEIEQMQGTARQAPATILGMALGGLSLVGAPFTAGFTSRYVLYQALVGWNLTWGIIVILASLGPLLAFVRFTIAALGPTAAPTARREPLASALVILAFSIVLLALGIYPRLLSLLPLPWPG